jgi:hypothetical protein
MLTTLRFFFLLTFGLLGLQPAACSYGAVVFVSAAEQCAHIPTVRNQVASAESAALK